MDGLDGAFVHGFEFNVPGSVWQAAETGEAPDEIGIAVLVDGVRLPPSGVYLSRAFVARICQEIARVGDGSPDAQRAALLALEHLAVGRFLPSLTEPVVAYFRGLAERMGMEAYLAGSDQALLEREIELLPPPSSELMEQTVLARLSRALADRVEEGEPVFPALKSLIEERDLEGKRREDFCRGLVPLLSATDELPRLREVLPLSQFFAGEQSPDGWQLSIAAAALAAEGLIGRSADALYRLAGRPQGWINTNCIAYATRQVERLAMQRDVNEQEVQRFRYAVLGLLDALKGAWFSRLHDQNMLGAMVTLLARGHLMPEYLINDMVRAALRHYGLSPSFWEALARSGQASGLGLHPQLHYAGGLFARLMEAMEDPARIDANLGEINQTLRFFQAQGNPEALYWMREVAAHVRRAGSKAAAVETGALLSNLLAAENTDLVRVVAAPVAVPAANFADLLPLETLPQMVRAMQGRLTNASQPAQREFCQ